MQLTTRPQRETLPRPRRQRVAADLPRDLPLWLYILVSLTIFAAFTGLGLLVRPGQDTRTINVDLDFLAGIENDPPPLGDPDAGTSAPAPEPASESSAPEPEPTPEPPPPPEAEMETTPEPPPVEPEPTPVLEPPPSPPSPSAPPPRAAAVPKPKPPVAPRRSAAETARDPGAGPGARGVATGVAGGKGGQRGGFAARPNPPYDSVMLARRYEGSGKARIIVSNGTIVSVSVVQSSGISYLDSKAATWIRSRWKPAPGTQGTFTLPFVFRLAR